MDSRNMSSSYVPSVFAGNDDTIAELKPQPYQIVVNIIEARKLVWGSSQSHNSFVLVGIGKKKHKTSVKRNSIDPFYKEFFIFEIVGTSLDIQRTNLWVAVLEPRCYSPPKIIGEANVGLGYIWSQPNHQLIRKWIQLADSRNPASAGIVGYLKVDISISRKTENQPNQLVLPSVVSNDVGDNIFYNMMSEQQTANYVITIYGAYGLPSGTAYGKEKKISKLPSTFVRVCFCGLMVKTSTEHRNNNPEYKERINIVEMFPNVNDVIRFEICSVEGFNRVLATATLSFADISYDGENGFLPTFGPSLLHMYCTSNYNTTVSGEDNFYYRGSLLVSLNIQVPFFCSEMRSIKIEPVPPFLMGSAWNWEDFVANCLLLEVSMIDQSIFEKTCGVAMTIGEMNVSKKTDPEFSAMMEDSKAKKLYYTGNMALMNSRSPFGYLEFFNSFPVLQIATQLPDFRFRMYRNNMIGAMVLHLENTVTMVEKRLRTYDYTSLSSLLGLLNKALDEVAVRIVKFVDVIQYCVENNEEQKQNLSTELDQKQMALQLDVLGKIYGSIIAKDCHANNIFGKRKRLKVRLSEVKLLIEKLNSLVGRSTEGWPDIIIWLLYNGSRAAYCKIPASDIIYSATADQNGQFCGKLRTIYMKVKGVDPSLGHGIDLHRAVIRHTFLVLPGHGVPYVTAARRRCLVTARRRRDGSTPQPLRCLRHMNSTASACDCLAGKIEVLLWMGHFRQMNTFNEFIPPGHDLRSKDEALIVTSIQMMVECRVFLFQVTLNDVKENEHSQIFVRIHINNTVKDTEPRPKSRSTIWNEMIKFEKLMFTSMERLEIHPPTALCEVYEKEDGASTESDNINLIGRFSMNSTVNTVDDKCPKLQTHDLYRGQELTGAIRLSIEILQNQEKVLSTTEYRNDDGEMDVNCVSDMKERIHVPLVPNFHTYKVDVYWWGLREVNNTKKPSVSLEIDDLTIQSEILSDKKRDCNFTSCAMSRVFEVASNENYFPPIVIKLFDSSTFGRTIFSGKKVVQNPKKYFVNWYLKDERESSLKSTPLLSSPLSEVSQRSLIFEDTHRIRSYSALNMQVKTPLWKSIFRRKEVDSERMSLLPIVSKENNIIKRLNSKSEDWWFRYYTALTVDVEDDSENEHSLPYNRLTIYNSELELLPGFDKFKDWCSTLKLYNGDKTGIPERDEQQKRGYVKTGIAIYKWPPPEDSVAVSASGVDLSNGYFSDHPGNESKKFLVRAYIVNGVNLAREFDGKSNPYIVIRCGKKEFGDRNTFVPMASNPIFGRMFEFRCTLPEDYLLKISLYDHNILPPDELIGSTTIDLEDRIYTKHRAMVGLPSDYDVNNWRDCNRPSVILEELCMRNHIPPPISAKSSTLLVNGVEYTDDARERKSYMTYQEQKERICLSILNKWHTIPICGHHLVPEHIETRTLIHDEKPGLEQGKIQMWIDIFPLDTFVHVPPPVDITPKNLGEYELRVIVWDVKNISLMNHEDKKKKKVFVKAWLGIPEHCQHSDVQKFKTDEVMTFNWRMIFDLQYHHAERKIIIEDKSPYTDVEEHAQPNLIVQVLNFDPENTCDILGTCTLNLITMCRGSKRFEDCKTETLRTLPKLNIFTTASVRAWWPLNKTDPNTCETFQTGAINMEVCILPKEKAVLTPVGYGRAGPWPLPSPGKFKTAFNVFFLCDNHSIEIKDVLADKSKKIKFAAFLGVVLVVGVISYYFNVFNYFFRRQIVDTSNWIKARHRELLKRLRQVESNDNNTFRAK